MASTNGGLSWVNNLDNAVLAATSEVPTLPLSNLKVPHLATKWRSVAGVLSVAWTADLLTALPNDIVGVFGANFTVAATWRLRLSSSAAHTGNLYDSGIIAMAPARRQDLRDPGAPVLKAQALLKLPSTVTARYWKLDLIDSGLPYLEAGLAWSGPLLQTERNFDYGQAPQMQDPSVTAATIGGQSYDDQRPQFMTDSFTCARLTDAEVQSFLDMDAAVGKVRNLLWVKNPGAAEMNRTAILGKQTELGPSPSVFFNRRSRQFQIAERL
jgi:hypothetical protein